MNRIQNKNHRINNLRIIQSCFDDKIYIPSNGIDALALGY